MRHIWSPWRMKYILHHEQPSNCIFCTALEAQDGHENLILARGHQVFLILNRFPYTGGHLMVVPMRHSPSLEDLDGEVRSELMEWIARSIQTLKTVYHPDAFNVGANIGEAAGAGVAEHVHFHIVPRWVGDTNFMSTVAGTRVLPEELTDTYFRLKKAWK